MASPTLIPLTAFSYVVFVSEASHEETTEKAAALHAYEEDETQQWKARWPFQHHSRVSRELESWTHVEWYTHLKVFGVRFACEDEYETQIKIQLWAEHDHVIGTVSSDYAFFGEHDQTAKFVLILGKDTFIWIEALFVCCIHCPTNGITETQIQVRFEAIDSRYEEQGRC